MPYVNLGRTGLQVSRFCLGTMNFGPLTSEGDSAAIMNRALALGINFFDPADAPQALEISLEEETLRRLNEIWPGPGGAAPEAYAW